MGLDTTSEARVESELAKLDTRIGMLKRQYDMFFAGALPREPLELRRHIEQTIRHFTHNPMRKYAHRFHFNALVSRFNVMSELWGKTVRQVEQGARRAPALDVLGQRDRLIARCRMADGDEPTEAELRRLHGRYVDARRRQEGDETAQPSYDSFVRGLLPSLRRLQEKEKCAEIELRLIQRDGKVQLKARPVR